MAGINHQPWKLAASILLCLYILSPNEAATLPRGKSLSLKLIHPDSPNSPFYRGNLTDIQRLDRLLNSSISRAQYIKSSILKSANITNTNFRPPLEGEPDGYLFVVEVSIGTGSGLKTYHLTLDTGSSLTWTKCIGVLPSFPRDVTKFNPKRSPTYFTLPPDDPLCKPPFYRPSPYGKKCNFEIKYKDKTIAKGELARDTFTFLTAGGRREGVPRLIFGCTRQSSGVSSEGQGIMGMGANPESFAMQLASPTGSRFSYCLMPLGNNDRHGFLRFGDNIVIKEPFQKTPILTFPGSSYYYLKLDDISFNGIHMDIPQWVFERQPNGAGGVMIDSGSSITYLKDEAFDRVKTAIVDHFKSRKFTPAKHSPFEVCYKWQPNLRVTDLPGMALHFARVDTDADADLHIKGEQVFKKLKDKGNKFFCWFMLRDNKMTIMGAYQQYNTRFTFDMAKKELQFAPENCALDATRP